MSREAEPYMDSPTMLSSVIDEAGTGFAIGSVSGFGYYFMKGSKGRTLGNSLRTATMNAPRIGSFGVGLALVFSAVSNGMSAVRNCNDPLNSFAVGAATGAAARASRGIGAASLAALCLGGLMAAVDVMATDTRKLEARLDWRPTGPPGCAADEYALLELTRKARSSDPPKRENISH